jgi:hypothetical protein
MPKEFLEHPLETAKKRLRAMMGNPKYSDSIKKQPGLVYELSTTSGTHTGRFVPTKQAILAYANLKMQSNDFSSYLQENKLLQTYMAIT